MKHKEDSTIERCYMILAEYSPTYLAVHEVGDALRERGFYANDNGIATELSKLVKEGRAVCRYRNGKRYKEWSIANPQNLTKLPKDISSEELDEIAESMGVDGELEELNAQELECENE